MFRSHALILCILLLPACALFRAEESPPTSLPPYAGLIRQVNRAEHYFIFESEIRVPTGTEIAILRHGKKIGRAKVLSFQDKKFQTADILSGAPVAGDLCEAQPSRLPVL